MSTTLSRWLRPETASNGAGSSSERLRWRAASRYKVSLTRVDLPEPETPVTRSLDLQGYLGLQLQIIASCPFQAEPAVLLAGVRLSGTLMLRRTGIARLTTLYFS